MGRQTYFYTVTIPRLAITIPNNKPKDKRDATALGGSDFTPAVRELKDAAKEEPTSKGCRSACASQEEWPMRVSDELGRRD